MNKIKQVIIHIRLWRWSATKSPLFQYFEIRIVPFIRVETHYRTLSISWCSPKIMYSVPLFVKEQFIELFGSNDTDIAKCLEDDIPF